jgi:hypothetical protein
MEELGYVLAHQVILGKQFGALNFFKPYFGPFVKKVGPPAPGLNQ